MRRTLAIVSAAIALLLVGGFFALGAFPPSPSMHPVHVVLPADRLAPA